MFVGFIVKRLITGKLVEWKEQKYRKPLILRGARQVGKSYSVLEFGVKHFNGNVHILDLEKRPELHRIFEKDLDVKRILSEMEIAVNKKINIESDLVFIDEIQNCKRALSALRYFYEDIPELHIIAAGSLIEFALKDIAFPVGRVQILTMHPMNFLEFLIAHGKEINEEAINTLPKVNQESLHNSILDELKKYFFVGGMPEVVKVFIETGSLKTAFEIQKNLVETFRQDFSKYAGRSDKNCLNDVFGASAKSVGKQIVYSHLSEGFTVPTIKKSFELLVDAKILTKIRSASASGLPLGASASEKKFKAVFIDIGLMQQVCGLQANSEYSKQDLLAIYRGALAEQFVGQELLSAGNEELFYWSRDAKSSNAEVDYLIAKKGKVIPLEVKSGPSGKLRSLNLLLDNYKNIPRSYVLSMRQFSGDINKRVIFLPLYYAYQLGKVE